MQCRTWNRSKLKSCFVKQKLIKIIKQVKKQIETKSAYKHGYYAAREGGLTQRENAMKIRGKLRTKRERKQLGKTRQMNRIKLTWQGEGRQN